VRDGQLRVIESGLSPNDWVVTEGIQRAFPGVKVDPQRTQLAAAAPEPAGVDKTDAAQPAPAGRDKAGAAEPGQK